MRQTGHKSIEMVLRYVRQSNAFTDNAALALGAVEEQELFNLRKQVHSPSTATPLRAIETL
jgi:hypothetical protein